MSDTTTRQVGALVQGFMPPPAPGPDRIEGWTVALERLDAASHTGDIWQAGQGADWIWDYMGYGPFAAAQDYADWATKMAGLRDPFFYAIRLHDSGRVAGVAAFLRIDPAQGGIEIGHILMTPALQKTVAATEALMLMIGWAFRAGYRRVEWKCDALNAPSRRAAIRLGFSYEGVFRQHMIYKGRNRDTAWYAIIDREWPALDTASAEWLNPANFDDYGQQRRSLSDLTAQAVPGRSIDRA